MKTRMNLSIDKEVAKGFRKVIAAQGAKMSGVVEHFMKLYIQDTQESPWKKVERISKGRSGRV